MSIAKEAFFQRGLIIGDSSY